jgi:hypothetical protein
LIAYDKELKARWFRRYELCLAAGLLIGGFPLYRFAKDYTRYYTPIRQKLIRYPAAVSPSPACGM